MTDDQPQLFNPNQTVTEHCDLCGATRPPGQTKAEACQHDQRDGEYAKRPAACLNSHDPRYAALPF